MKHLGIYIYIYRERERELISMFEIYISILHISINNSIIIVLALYYISINQIYILVYYNIVYYKV